MGTEDKLSLGDLLKLSEELRKGQDTIHLKHLNALDASANETQVQGEIYYTPIAPCPFCGNENVDCERYDVPQPRLLYRNEKHQYTCHCKQCNAMGPYKDTAEAAIEGWNGPKQVHDECLAEIKRLKESVADIMALFTPSESEGERDNSL